MLENLFILLLVFIAFLPFLLIGALIELNDRNNKIERDIKLARKRREYVEQYCKR